jgi:thiol-disulfide isomerase/thioredoxin
MRTRLTVPTLLVALLLILAACGNGDDAPAEATGGADPGADADTDTDASDSDAADDAAADTATDDNATTDDSATDDSASGDDATGDTFAFTAQTIDGEDFDGSTLAGKPAVLWFWAPWCPTCRGQASTIAEVADTHAGELNVVGVAGLDDSVDYMREFVSDTGTGGFPHLADSAGAIWQRFQITQQSVYVLVDASGTVVHSGFLNNEDLVAQVEQLTA